MTRRRSRGFAKCAEWHAVTGVPPAAGLNVTSALSCDVMSPQELQLTEKGKIYVKGLLER